jgi:cobalt-zinc-cadmium efflux system outer membrane protein
VEGTKGVFEISIAQDVLDILMIPLRKRMARADLAATEADVTAAVLDTAAEAKTAFYMLQAARQSLSFRQDVLDAAEASYDVATRLHEAGNITELSLAMTRAAWEEAKLAVVSAETDMLEARERMNVLMGLYGRQTTWTIDDALPPIPEEPLDLTDLERRAVVNSLDLIVLRKRMQATAARVGMEVTELVFPEIAGGALAEREPGGEWSGGPTAAIGVPIFDWGQARTAAGRAEMRRLWNLYTATAVEVRSATRAARYRLLAARRQGEHYQRVVLPLAEQITGETQLQYNAMQLGVFQLLEAKTQEINARERAILARRNYWIARTEIQQILNGRMLHHPITGVVITGGMGGGDNGGH